MINATRLSEGVSLEAFARQLGVSRAYLCDVEKGQRDETSRDPCAIEDANIESVRSI
jgi:transcriptional regulator with XRE-family HTH domain